MKKQTLITAITINFFLITINLFSQPCLPEGITFNTQAQIDNFQVNYPGCNKIEGDVYILGDDINNLNGLNVLTSFGGHLEIVGTSLVDLSGLGNISLIGEGLRIGTGNEGGIFGNPNLQSLYGLNNLTSIGGQLNILNNDSLISLSGLDNLVLTSGLYIMGNDVLPSLAGLENLAVINGSANIGWTHAFQGIYNGNSSLTSFAALSNLYYISGDFKIYGNPLTSLTGLENLTLIGGDFTISSDSITNLSGLGNLTLVGGRFSVGSPFGGNVSLVNLIGIDSLTTIGGSLNIAASPSLHTLAGLENLVSIGAELIIQNNDSLKSLTGLQNLESGSIEDLIIKENESLTECDIQVICNYLAAPNGNVYIHDNAPGCNNQQEVEDACDSIQTSIWEISKNISFTINPNPLESVAIVTYTLNQNSRVTLKILDLSGRLVATLVNNYQQQGEQRVVFNTEGLKPGVYFCTLKTNDGMQTKKIFKL